MGKEKKASFAKQATILMAASLFVRFIGFIYKVPLTNLIGDEGNAIYGTGYYIYNFFLVFSSAGLPAAISKMVSERIVLKQYKNAHKVFEVSLILTISGGLIGGIVMGLGAEYFSKLVGIPESKLTIMSLAPTVFIVAIMSSYRGYFQGLKTTIPTAISQIIEQIFNAVSSVLLAFIAIQVVKDSTQTAWAAAGGTLGTGIGALTGLLFLMFAYSILKPSLTKRNDKNPSDKVTESTSKLALNMFKLSAVIVAGTAIMSVTNVIDMKMVNSILLNKTKLPLEEVKQLYGQLTGKYNTLTTLPIALSTAFATVIVPNIASSVVIRDRKAVKRKVNTALRLTMLIAIPASIGIGILGEPILLLLFPKYPEGARLLHVGAVSIIFLSLVQISTGILQGIDKAHFPIIAIAVGAVVKVILNAIFIPMKNIDVVGSVIGTIGCYIVASFLDLWALKQYTRIKIDFLSIFGKPLIAGSVMGVVCFVSYYLINLISKFTGSNVGNGIATIGSIIISIITYALILLRIRGITKEDVELFPMGKKISALLVKLKLI